MDNESLAHTKWNCTYHIVFIPKGRRKIMYGALRRDIREILKELCDMKDVELIKGAVCPDHVHMYVAIPPKMEVSKFMSYLKGKSALMIFDRHPEQRNRWDKHFWARGYYVETVGNVNEETIKKYIEEQYERDRREDSQNKKS
ncbi:MAG: IS200/IS605 family transposase [Bulleidia sp.]|nr:IS200/IS605 family transposase [Bulleidia sp.]